LETAITERDQAICLAEAREAARIRIARRQSTSIKLGSLSRMFIISTTWLILFFPQL
jgi:hypothetical protein